MSQNKKLRLDGLPMAGFPQEFIREMSLVVAQNELASLTTGETLYDVVLNGRVAHFCAPLDAGLSANDLGTRTVPANPDAPYLEVDAAVAFLAELPRGAWARFRHHGGGWDAYMSDGAGGVGTGTGNKFTYGSPTAPDLSFESVYGAVLSYPAYEARQRIRAEIVAASFLAAGDPVGRTVRDTYLMGKTWARIETVGRTERQSEGGVEGIVVRMTRPGVKAVTAAISPSTFVSLFKPGYVMPEAYADAAGIDRTRTLGERREKAAREALAAVSGEIPDFAPGRHVYFRADGDALIGRIHLAADAPGNPSAGIEVTFAPGSAEVTGTSLDHPGPPPAPGPR